MIRDRKYGKEVCDSVYDKNFEKSIAFVLEVEGGYVNNSNDPGGETKYGISKRSYPYLAIKDLTVDAAKKIYYEDYWLAAQCKHLKWPLCLVHFDAAVNIGVGEAKRWLKVLNQAVDTTDIVSKYIEMRRRYYTSLANSIRTYTKFLKGWLNRLDRLKKYIETNAEGTNG
ncbi:glycoside hydrolase family 108 protein [Candidatus Magnetominusculus xianensis]|uniref:Peptidoglycan-binding protein n=1 Tax=Candidatus Magnetominusculus xianensis TaxID=1748249 RepID=A0ABR5SAN8_9BACT|nr:N-acetylmuramidase [Candidatus Magnetominusculus xianensis]KWT73781.1 peptidoglycan-binding protein [Candidatus Magnetominusculus xianensis]MBF0404802.1 peptidoglycan-binding protein [Nitrospirota bacterium]